MLVEGRAIVVAGLQKPRIDRHLCSTGPVGISRADDHLGRRAGPMASFQNRVGASTSASILPVGPTGR